MGAYSKDRPAAGRESDSQGREDVAVCQAGQRAASMRRR